ncbi:hypothetical protein E2562_018070 [Oryza meyeriana var. granulata]|uniref:Growth-regulating factor n=1 Tax=Oryza meyeriana var. granulata TaxID=110450 RepID=A0A6G1CRU0_9ORYZ|nr:hypothetical protein E2562_018070 [Oryza meyeriana var. granulata]
MMAGGGGGGGRCLFTATQWQELEHQALIYKYMAVGAPVPPDLLLNLRHHGGSGDVDTAPSLAFPSHHPSLGWGCYGAAAAQYGRRVEDPEPGRCRRTDGKKWRCSREAYGDSKYCEKHMHRGKNRSRKPVEMAPAAGVYRPSALSISPPTPDAPSYRGGGHHHHHLRLPDAASARAPADHAGGAPLQLHLDSFHASTSPPPSYHRYATHSTALFPTTAAYGGNWSSSKEHCLTLGGAADLSLDKPADDNDATSATTTTTEKPLRRFFDEWPRDDGRPWDGTQLSISIPTASRYHNNGDRLQMGER